MSNFKVGSGFHKISGESSFAQIFWWVHFFSNFKVGSSFPRIFTRGPVFLVKITRGLVFQWVRGPVFLEVRGRVRLIQGAEREYGGGSMFKFRAKMTVVKKTANKRLLYNPL